MVEAAAYVLIESEGVTSITDGFCRRALAAALQEVK
jgi:hypothetical protein